MLTQEQIKKIEATNIVALGSSNKLNEPRIIYVMPSKVEANRIVISNIQMKETIKNILENNKVFINFYTNDNDCQIKISGIARVEDDTDEFFEVKNFEEENNLPEDLKVHSIIVVDIKSVEETFG